MLLLYKIENKKNKKAYHIFQKKELHTHILYITYISNNVLHKYIQKNNIFSLSCMKIFVELLINILSLDIMCQI